MLARVLVVALPAGAEERAAGVVGAGEQARAAFARDALRIARGAVVGGVAHDGAEAAGIAVRVEQAAIAAVGGAIAAAAASDDPKLREIEAILDERIRPYLAGDGGWLEVVELAGNTLKIRYEGACGSCPSSLTGTLMAIENMIKEEIDPEIEVIAT